MTQTLGSLPSSLLPRLYVRTLHTHWWLTETGICTRSSPGRLSRALPLSYPVCSYSWSVMIAHRESECISLSVLFVARVMIADQWENQCILLFVLRVARV